MTNCCRRSLNIAWFMCRNFQGRASMLVCNICVTLCRILGCFLVGVCDYYCEKAFGMPATFDMWCQHAATPPVCLSVAIALWLQYQVRTFCLVGRNMGNLSSYASSLGKFMWFWVAILLWQWYSQTTTCTTLHLGLKATLRWQSDIAARGRVAVPGVHCVL